MIIDQYIQEAMLPFIIRGETVIDCLNKFETMMDGIDSKYNLNKLLPDAKVYLIKFIIACNEIVTQEVNSDNGAVYKASFVGTGWISYYENAMSKSLP